MKRIRLDETIKEGSDSQLNSSSSSSNSVYNNHQQLPTAIVTLNYSSSVGSVKVVSEGMQSGLYPPPPVNYGAMPTAAVTTPHPSKSQSSTMQPLSISGGTGGSSIGTGSQQIRNNVATSPPTPTPMQEMQQSQQQSQFQRLKVEDALSYLDLVKFKFGSKPQVYNDFLDIMKEFKSQSIDTPGVIQRVSNLFKGFPELISGFNTFLPPGYKIEVQRSDQGYAFQVSVSMPSPTSGSMTSDSQQQKSAMIMRGSGTINMSGSLPLQTISTVPPPPPPPQQQQQITSPPPPPSTTTPQQQQQQPPSHQSLSITPHVPPNVAAQATTVPVVHHSSTYGSGVTNYNNSLSFSAAQVAVSQALQGHTDSPQNQPVQFNHAINYVNKIKNRFQDQPEKYKKFLDILHIYQKDQRTMKESVSSGPGGGKHLTEQEVYSQVAKLFENQSDLLAEFGQFLPDATSHINHQPLNDHSLVVMKKPPNKTPFVRDNLIDRHFPHKSIGGGVVGGGGVGGGVGGGGGSVSGVVGHIPGQLKRSPPYPAMMHRDAPLAKKHKISSCRDVTLAEAGKYATLNDYAFFDKVRKAVRTQEVYNNFLRCLSLFNQEIISKSELIQVINPFLGKYPELMRWFREFLGQQNDVESIGFNVARNERSQCGSNELALEIDLTTAKRLGASYCVIPAAQEGLRCSGRTQLCKEVLNDQWVSFPTWSEDSTFVSSRKTQYEEYMYRCEDERFELDVVIETNASTIRILEGVQKKLSRMNADEVARYRLDDCLGGSSPTLHQRALKRIYGDKAQDIIDGLKRNPAVAVPVVLRRLKTKEEEWREAQKGFNKIWREQNEKYYLKSLDHQGINFKQIDVKALRSKSLFNEIETIFDERHEQNEHQQDSSNSVVDSTTTTTPTNNSNGGGQPHLILPYKDRTILDDAANLLIHHVKRQTGIQKGEKRRIKHLLRQFLPDLFFHPKQQLTDDEREDEDEKEDPDDCSNNGSPISNNNNNNHKNGKKKENEFTTTTSDNNSKLVGDENNMMEIKTEETDSKEEIKTTLSPTTTTSNVYNQQSMDPDDAYTLFMANNNWYIFVRLHAILCDRLVKIYERAVQLAAEENKLRTNRKESTSVALRLKPKAQIEIEDYYPAFLDMVKNLLDGNMDANTYEDTLREMFGIHAYIAFTLDKVIIYAVRQLQQCVTERTATACTDLYLKEQKRGGAGGQTNTAHKRQHLEFAYQRAAEKAVQDENCFKIHIFKKHCRMTIELLDTESADDSTTKKVDELNKWNSYKERYTDCTKNSNLNVNSTIGGGGGGTTRTTIDGTKPRSPVYLNRNLRIYKKRQRLINNKQQQSSSNNDDESSSSSSNNNSNKKDDEEEEEEEGVEENEKKFGIIEELERKLNDKRIPPERNQSDHPGFDVNDETQCKFNSQDSKIMLTVNKDSYLYKISAFSKARKSHPVITKRLSGRFREWLKRWQSANVSETQLKQCTDWLMGRADNLVPNKTRVINDNDLTRTPYVSYNRYRVDKVTTDEHLPHHHPHPHHHHCT